MEAQKKFLNRSIERTADGSPTLFLPELDERFHSKHGAIQEAQHVFISMGFDALNQEQNCILEIGFGTGLNALLTAIQAEKTQKNIQYIGLEAYPLEPHLWQAIDYGLSDSGKWYTSMHEGPWENWQEVSPHFALKKCQAFMEDFHPEFLVDCIYYDAFGPRAQEEMWEEKCFFQLFQWLKPGGILVTYCAKGSVRRAMLAAGFEVERLPGPPGKREMLRAKKV